MKSLYLLDKIVGSHQEAKDKNESVPCDDEAIHASYWNLRKAIEADLAGTIKEVKGTVWELDSVFGDAIAPIQAFTEILGRGTIDQINSTDVSDVLEVLIESAKKTFSKKCNELDGSKPENDNHVEEETDPDSNPKHIAVRLEMINDILSDHSEYHQRVLRILAPERVFAFADDDESKAAIIELLEQKPELHSKVLQLLLKAVKITPDQRARCNEYIADAERRGVVEL
jgi:hypothetical protein